MNTPTKQISIKQRDAQLLGRKLTYARIGSKVEVRIQDGSTIIFKISKNENAKD